MIVVTMDQRGSRTTSDAVPRLLETLATLPALRPFQRTAGDEVQAVFDDAAAAIAAALGPHGAGEWNVGLGVGRVKLPLPAETRAGAGEAFEAAREAVEQGKKTQALLALRAPGDTREAARLEAELALLALCLRRRTPQQADAARLRAGGLGQAGIARELGISQQAVSKRLAGGMYDELLALREATVHALEVLDRSVGGVS